MSRAFEVLSYYDASNITLPKRQTMYSAGYDLASAETITIPPKTIAFVKTGLKVRLGKDEVLLVYARSSLAIKKQLIMSNGVGVIDADLPPTDVSDLCENCFGYFSGHVPGDVGRMGCE